MKRDLVAAVNTLGRIQKQYPLALSRLWIPHCHRFDGKGSQSDRARGCGQPMRRINAGIWRCDQCDITETRSSQIEIPLSFPKLAYLVAGGNRAGKTEIGAQLAVAFAAGRSEW